MAVVTHKLCHLTNERGWTAAHPDNDWFLVLGGSDTDDLGSWHSSASDVLDDGLAGSVPLFNDIGVRFSGADVTSLLPPVKGGWLDDGLK